VRWRETIMGLQAAGIDRFVDVGPGQVLAKLVKRIAKSATKEPVRV
jgi:[acyl-carrier-protein] S-malonyltransferase